MRTHSRLIFAALAATMLLTIGVGNASARNLSARERNFELIWSEALGSPKTKLRILELPPAIECRVTLLGRFNENTIVKNNLRDQATIDHGELEACTNGTATIRTETMPWTIRYGGFIGTLPRIQAATLNIIAAQFRIRDSGNRECGLTSEAEFPLVGVAGQTSETIETGFERTGEPELITASGRLSLSGEFGCTFGRTAEFNGVGLIRNLPRTAKLRITLI